MVDLLLNFTLWHFKLLSLIVFNLVLCCAFTIMIEYVPIVKCLRVSTKYFVATNILTNVTLNISLIFVDLLKHYKFINVDRLVFEIIFEILVLIVEIYLFYIFFNKTNLKRIIIFTTLANLLSGVVGTLLVCFVIGRL